MVTGITRNSVLKYFCKTLSISYQMWDPLINSNSTPFSLSRFFCRCTISLVLCGLRSRINARQYSCVLSCQASTNAQQYSGISIESTDRSTDEHTVCTDILTTIQIALKKQNVRSLHMFLSHTYYSFAIVRH